MNQPADPLAAIQAALRQDPNNPDLYNTLGCVYYRQGRLNDAIPVFEKAIRLGPQSWEAHFNLANCFIKRDQLDQAISHYITALDLNPEHPDIQVNLAMTYVSEGNFSDALPWLEKSAARDPKFAELQGHLAQAYLELGKSELAKAQYVKANKLDPNRSEWQHNLAVLYLRDNQQELAIEHFTRSLQLNPNNPTAEHMLKALQQDTQYNSPRQYVKDLFDQYASYYNKHVTDTLEYKVPSLLRQAVGEQLKIHTTQQRILDVGCGTGLCGVYFRDLAVYLAGVDLSYEMLQHALSSQAYDSLCCADITQNIPGAGLEYFNIVIAADVFVYIGELQKIFRLIHSALSNGGLFAFSVEQTSIKQIQLQKSGRFAHSSDYIHQQCTKNGFKTLSNNEVVLRKAEEQEIIGEIFVIQKI